MAILPARGIETNDGENTANQQEHGKYPIDVGIGKWSNDPDDPIQPVVCGHRRIMRLASDGTPFFTWVKVMGRRLRDYMMDSVVFIYPSKESADAAEERGATGFLLGVPSKRVPSLGHVYVVTNAHVVAHGSQVVRMNKASGQTVTFDLVDGWISHPDGDDVAIASLEGVTDPNLASRIFHSELLLTQEAFKANGVGIGDTAYMVGRFLGHEHRDANKPVIQHGAIASPLRQITNPETGHEQESILIELRSIGGYSGSVVILDPPGRILGINFCHLPVRSPVKFQSENDEAPSETDYFVDTLSGMAAIVPAWKIGKMLDMEQFQEQRKRDDERLARQAGRRVKPILDDTEGSKRKPRDVSIPPLGRKKFFGALEKATRRKNKQ